MNAQLQLDMPAAHVDLDRLVKFTPDPFGARWVCCEGNKRRGVRGKSLGVLEIRNARSFAVVLLLDDGRIESFHPESLHPDIPANAGYQALTPNG